MAETQLTKEFSYDINTSKPYLAIFCVFLVYACLSQYVFLSLFGGICLMLMVYQFLQSNFSPIFLYFFGFQWLQVFTFILLGDSKGDSLESLYSLKDVNFLIGMTFIQILLMSLLTGKYLKNTKLSRNGIIDECNKLDEKKIIYAYVLFSLLFPVLLSFTSSNPSLFQLVQTFSLVRNVLLIMMIFILFAKKSKYKNAIIIILIVEFVLGFVTYFSSFREVILYLVVVYLTVNTGFKKGVFLKILPLGIFTCFLLVFWSYVKYDYRNYLNGGNRQQQVSVSTGDALGFLWNKIENAGKDDFNAGVQTSINRIQYMEEYAIVYQHVPAIIPYSNGENLYNTMTFLFTPRSWNSSKRILDPSEKTNYYTGINHATANQGTSISMGYFCDLYIDFGIYMMIIPLLLITLAIIAMCNYMYKKKGYNIIFTLSLVIGVVMNFGLFESDIIYFLGTIRNTLFFLVLAYWLIFPRLQKYIQA